MMTTLLIAVGLYGLAAAVHIIADLRSAAFHAMISKSIVIRAAVLLFRGALWPASNLIGDRTKCWLIWLSVAAITFCVWIPALIGIIQGARP